MQRNIETPNRLSDSVGLNLQLTTHIRTFRFLLFTLNVIKDKCFVLLVFCFKKSISTFTLQFTWVVESDFIRCCLIFFSLCSFSLLLLALLSSERKNTFQTDHTEVAHIICKYNYSPCNRIFFYSWWFLIQIL